MCAMSCGSSLGESTMHRRCGICSYIESDRKNRGCIGCVSVQENDALEGEWGNCGIGERSKKGIGVVVKSYHV